MDLLQAEVNLREFGLDALAMAAAVNKGDGGGNDGQ